MTGITWGWAAYHPGTRREVDTDTLTEALLWFAAETLEWAVRKVVLPAVVVVVVLRKGADE